MSDENLPEWHEDFRDPDALADGDANWQPPPGEEFRKKTSLKATPELGGLFLPANDPLIRRKRLKIWSALAVGAAIMGGFAFGWHWRANRIRPQVEWKRGDEAQTSEAAPRVTLEQALSKIALGKYEEAAALFRQIEGASAIDPANAIKFHQSYGDLALLLGDLYLAAGQYERIVSTQGMESPIKVLNNLAYVRARQGVELDDAEKYIRAALKREPKNAAFLDTLGEILGKQNRWKDAEKAYRDGLALVSENKVILASLHEHLGNCLMRQNRPEEALNHWRLASIATPENAMLWEKVKRAKKETP